MKNVFTKDFLKKKVPFVATALALAIMLTGGIVLSFHPAFQISPVATSPLPSYRPPSITPAPRPPTPEPNPPVVNPGVFVDIVIDQNSRFTSTYARTDTHLFFTEIYHELIRDDEGEPISSQPHFHLHRIPLNNINYRQEVNLPGAGEIEIVGLSETYLFVSRFLRGESWSDKTYGIFSISLNNLEVTKITTDAFYSVPRFHVPSGSIITAYAPMDADVNGHHALQGIVQLSTLNLETKESVLIFEFESYNFDSGSGWWNLADDSLMFVNSSWGAGEMGSDFIYINADLEAKIVNNESIENMWAGHNTLPYAVEELFEGLNVRSWQWTTVGNRIYYILPVATDDYEWNWTSSLWRVDITGKNNVLIKEDVNYNRLFGIDDRLFALYGTGHGDDSEWVHAVTVSENGQFSEIFGAGWSGHNSVFFVSPLENSTLVLAMQGSFFG